MANPNAIAGRGGSVRVNGTPVTTVGQIDTWSLTWTQAMYDQSALGDQFTSDVAGLRSCTGTISGKWSVTSDAGQTTLNNAVINGTTVGLNLLVNGTDGYEFTANIDQVAVSNPVNGLVTFSCNFRNYGQVFFL